MNNNIVIAFHTLVRAEERGTNKEEITDVLKTGTLFSAKYGKKGKFKVYEYNKKRNDKFFKEKRVEVIYTEEENNIFTVTVYVYYGEWEKK